MFDKNSRTDQKLVEKLTSLQAVPPRDPAVAKHQRAIFLNEVKVAAQTVSATPKGRQIGWNNKLFQKEIKTMFTSIVAVIVAITLALGGAGVTVAAAQTALPGEALYGIKTASEDARLALSSDEAQFALNLEFSQRRIEEMAALGLAGKEVPEGVAVRLEAQIENAFRIAAEQQDAMMLKTLEQLRTRLMDQEALCQQLQEQNQNQNLVQIKEMIQERLRLIENGMQDPQAFRTQVGEGLNRPDEMVEPGTGGAGEPQEPGAGAGEPGAGEEPGNPDAGSGEPQQEPESNGPGEPQQPSQVGEPQQTPGPGEKETKPGEPQQTPQAGEQQQTPYPGTGEPQATPGTGSGEPGGKP